MLGFNQGLTRGSPSSLQGTQIYLYGGRGNDTFLGCWNCNEYASNSVLNEYGPHGSTYASDSIFNRYGQFGSPYSQYSPCNRYAANPPVLVNGSGKFFGYVTLNRYKQGAITDRETVAWLKGVCQSQ